MKKILIALAIILTLAVSLPLSAFAETAQSPAVCACGHDMESKYCPDCGGLNPIYARAWDCTCGTADNLSKFCPACGALHPDHTGCWDCPTCENKDNFGDACTLCGAARLDEDGNKTSFGFRPESLKETLPVMGMGMLGIFLVIGAIVLVVLALSAISKKADAGKEE